MTAESVKTSSKWIALNSILSLWCTAIGSCSPCIILFIAYLLKFIFSYMPFLQYEECLAFDFLASKVVYCLAFCLQSPQLNNLYCYELGFYSAKEVILILQNVWRSRNKRTQSPLQGSHTVELDIIKNSCLKIGLLIIFSF